MKIFIVSLFIVYAIALSLALARAGYRSSGGSRQIAESEPGTISPGGEGPPRSVPSRPGASFEEGRLLTARGDVPQEQPRRLLIVGATGGTGRQLVAQALERGYSVTAFVRDPARLRGISDPNLTVARGDILDRASVDAAMRGQDAVVSALGHKRYFSLSRILSDGTRNILLSMEAHGVPRLVCETSLGIGDSAGRMGLLYTLFTIPVVLPLYFWDKARQERLIAESRVAWVIVRPGALTDAGKRGRVRHGRHVGSVLRTVRVSRADVAAFMLDQLTSDAYLRSAPGVAW